MLSNVEAIELSDEEIDALLCDPSVEPVGLLPALAYHLGDLSLLDPELVPNTSDPLTPNGGWSARELARVRELAGAGLARLRDPNRTEADPQRRARALAAGIAWVTGRSATDAEFEMLREELAVEPDDQRAPDWHLDDIAPGRRIRAMVIGAGMSGILAAHRLDQVGVQVTVVDKNPGVGGTWFENTYPGCRVDVANHTYAYSSRQRFDWPEYNSSQPTLLEYFTDCADAWGVTRMVRTETEVTELVWQADSGTWRIEMVGPEGTETAEAEIVVSAVGQLNRPKLPGISGIDDFGGQWWHSARWRHDVDLCHRRVGIIGTGSSAAQFIPKVAEQARSVTVFQRTANWVLPRPQAASPVSPAMLWLLTHVPTFGNWHRLVGFWRSLEVLRKAVIVDPSWIADHDIEHSVSESNAGLRAWLETDLRASLADRPDLCELLLPDHPVGSKRFILDNGDLAAALKSDKATVLTTPIERIEPAGVRTVDGSIHQLDVLIYGTGFAASQFLMPMRVTGTDGVDLHQVWSGDARAFKGITVPDMPNLFLMYGPNTNIVVNGSIIFFSECEAHYLTQAVRALAERGATAMAPTAQTCADYNRRIDAGNAEMAWGASAVKSWYKNETGRSAQNWPFAMIEFWNQTRSIDPDNYEWFEADSAAWRPELSTKACSDH